jgi:hypothetical protein
MMADWNDLDKLDRLFVVWAFLFQLVLIVHYVLRRPFFESYTLKFGWIVYALCIPAAVISVILLLGGKRWSFWLGGFLFLLYAAFGYWVDYVLDSGEFSFVGGVAQQTRFLSPSVGILSRKRGLCGASALPIHAKTDFRQTPVRWYAVRAITAAY